MLLLHCSATPVLYRNQNLPGLSEEHFQIQHFSYWCIACEAFVGHTRMPPCWLWPSVNHVREKFMLLCDSKARQVQHWPSAGFTEWLLTWFPDPILILCSLPLFMEEGLDQPGSCRKTCQSITERRGNTNRSSLGVAQVSSGEHHATQAGPSPADRRALSPPPSFPCSNFALRCWWLSLLNGRRILLQTWAD